MDKNKQTLAVAMSGGVDSSVAAFLMKKEGFRVVGVMMDVLDRDLKLDPGCSACFAKEIEVDIEDARKVAKKLDIPFYLINLKEEFKTKVLSFFRNEYREARTPNPCIKCNIELKFGAILKELRRLGVDFDVFATGHYARVEFHTDSGQYRLYRGLDPLKDQSYFLYHLCEEQLRSIRFPLGKYKKTEIRQIARDNGLDVSNKTESMDFFKGGYHKLFKEPLKSGRIVNTRGEILGEHKGIVRYTVGQRRGLGIAAPEPLYVLNKDKESNTVIAGYQDELFHSNLIAKGMSWVNISHLESQIEVKAKIRYQHKAVEVLVKPLKTNQVEVVFKEPIAAITPGQIVVFYDQDRVLGGGTIQRFW
jgi:tRNA-specific 2-thiouridylase